ncbi:MAG: hypothetical protein IJC71_02590 [Clostridia bacterium]|nr:hypothetical protein [Clostridia bacterium]
MIKVKTYKLIIDSKDLAFTAKEQSVLLENLHDINLEEYYASVEYTPKSKSKYSFAITIIKDSLENAQPVCKKISKILEENKYKFQCVETELWLGADVPKIAEMIMI